MKIHNRRRIVLTVMASLLFAMLPVASAQGSEATMIYSLNNPRVSNGVSTWDCIYFGNYWQEDTNGDGIADKNDAKTPIKWRVLSVDGDDAFLLADKSMEVKKYNERFATIPWEKCTMRSWLNGYGADINGCGIDYTTDNFLDNAFSEAEQNAIPITTVVNTENGSEDVKDTMDKVYLLSLSEAKNEKYGFYWKTKPNLESETAISDYTSYVTGGEDIERDFWWEGDRRSWWLRSQEEKIERLWSAPTIRFCGDVMFMQTNMAELAVRPAIHLDLSHTSLWTYAGTVAQGTDVTITPTPSPTPTLEVTEKTIKPAKVKNVTVKAKGKKLQVRWKKAAWAKSYEVSVSSSKKFNPKDKLIANNTTKKTKITIKNLKRRKRYYVRVRAYTVWNNQKIYGKWSKVTKVKIK